MVSAIENLAVTRRSEIGSPWRALTPFDQAALYLVWVRHDSTFAELGAHFCGSTHDAAATRTDQIIEATAKADVELIADLGYHGVSGTVRTPAKRKPGRGPSPRDQCANREHARVRCQGERGFARLKAYKVL